MGPQIQNPKKGFLQNVASMCLNWPNIRISGYRRRWTRATKADRIWQLIHLNWASPPATLENSFAVESSTDGRLYNLVFLSLTKSTLFPFVHLVRTLSHSLILRNHSYEWGIDSNLVLRWQMLSLRHWCPTELPSTCCIPSSKYHHDAQSPL